MLVTAIYNTVDTFFVARVSTDQAVNTAAQAAVGLVLAVMAIIQAFGFFCGQGSGNYLSRMLGAGKTKEANEMASTGFALSLIIGVVIAVLGNIFAEPLALFLGATQTTMEFTIQYMRIILIGTPFMMSQFAINNQLRFQGSAMYAMVGLLFGALMNMILDPVLIMGLHMEVRGAAIATVVGQLTSFIVLLIGTSKGENIRLSIKNVHLNRHYISEIANGGSPSLFRQGLQSVSTLLLNRTAGAIGGDAAIAGMSVAGRIMLMMGSALIGFGQGYQPMCSYNYGAGLTKRVKEGFKFCVKYSSIVLVGISALCYFFAGPIISVFTKDSAAAEVGMAAMRFMSLTGPLTGTIVICNMMLQSMGKGAKASLMASSRNGLFFIPMIIILPKFFGITGVEISQACADVLSFILAIPFAYSELRKFDD